MDYESGIQSGVNARGKVNDEERDDGYTVEMAIPWTAFNQVEPKAEKPDAGATWRLNFYVLDARNEHDQRAVAWSPPRVGDFHVPRRFGSIVFAAPTTPIADPKALAGKKPAKAK
jgi:hypothetical protein